MLLLVLVVTLPAVVTLVVIVVVVDDNEVFAIENASVVMPKNETRHDERIRNDRESRVFVIMR